MFLFLFKFFIHILLHEDSWPLKLLFFAFNLKSAKRAFLLLEISKAALSTSQERLLILAHKPTTLDVFIVQCFYILLYFKSTWLYIKFLNQIIYPQKKKKISNQIVILRNSPTL